MYVHGVPRSLKYKLYVIVLNGGKLINTASVQTASRNNTVSYTWGLDPFLKGAVGKIGVLLRELALSLRDGIMYLNHETGNVNFLWLWHFQ